MRFLMGFANKAHWKTLGLEALLKKGAGSSLTNPRFQNLGKQALKALNSNKIKSFNRIVNQMEKMSDDPEVNKYLIDLEPIPKKTKKRKNS